MKAPSFATLWGRKEATPPPDVEAAALRSDRFRLEREADWKRLEQIVARLESGRLRRVSDDDILALPALYRTAASSLAVARETTLDAATLDYLESLVQRAWFQVYGPRTSALAWFRRFLGGGLSASIRAIWLDILIALAAMIAGTIVGYLLVASDAAWFHALVPAGFGGDRAPGASVEALQKTLSGAGEDGRSGLSVFAAFLFSNNAKVSILAFALGFAFGIPSILLLVQNMALLGAMLWVFNDAGLAVDFIAWLSVHGTTELFAILLAGGAGIHVGRSMAFPGAQSVLAAAAQSGRRAAQVMTGVVLMLMIAALLEGYVRQLVTDTPSRFIIGGTMLAIWLAYFFALRPRDRQGDA
ncbi:MAG: stage II sporulation protein M [Novosphingobium sp.]|nr:stage II sporulation protein M [Novosphingobium sp.]